VGGGKGRFLDGEMDLNHVMLRDRPLGGKDYDRTTEARPRSTLKVQWKRKVDSRGISGGAGSQGARDNEPYGGCKGVTEGGRVIFFKEMRT